ncbi:MAG: hypothetical protein JSW47_17885 [Phycisphaerales bacterium]|nr:MAG: hypothetical protein JSW47_17885 [Phycisphaerales bacterium]
MKVRYYIDARTGQAHIHRHGVSETEVEDVLINAGEDRPGAEGSRIAIGQTRAGRYLRVIYVLDPKRDELFVVTGYELIGKPLLAYRRRLRRKGKK